MAEGPKEKMSMDLDFSGLGLKEKPKPLTPLDLGLDWGTRPKLVMDYCIRSAQ